MFSRNGKIMSSGGAIALICFFMPWVFVSCQGQPVANFTGWQLAAGGTIDTASGPTPLTASPELFLVFAAAAAALFMLYRVYQQRTPLRKAARNITLMAVVSLILIFLKFAGNSTQSGQGISIDYQFGFWGTVLANLAMVYGGISELRAPKPEPGITDTTVRLDASLPIAPAITRPIASEPVQEHTSDEPATNSVQ